MRAFRVTVSERDEDLATALLWELGTTGIEVGTAAPGRAALLAYFPEAVGLADLESALPAAAIEAVPVPDVDWVARFRASFRPFRAGRFLIAPPWDRPPSDEDVILVDPGRAFGTGTHETTRLCLGALEEASAEHGLGRVLDVGTGTGILAVAASRLGAALVVASDNDDEATASARRHAVLNRVRIHVVRGEGVAWLRPGAFDLVLANLTAPLLVSLAPSLAAQRRPDGLLVLSGLLESDLGEIRAAFAACGKPRVRREGEWAALVYRGAP